MSIQILVLAAGKGKRMHSSLAKVLQPLAGIPLLAHVVNKARALTPKAPPLVIIGHQGEQIRQKFANEQITWIEQKEQLGTAHAVQCALPSITAKQVLILYGDVPLIALETLQRLILETPSQALGIITAELNNPSGYGRIIRNHMHEVTNIIEEKDASPSEKNIMEVNSGIYLIPTTYLQQWLPKIKTNNKQEEYYLTDIVSLAVQDKVLIHSVQPKADFEIFGINDRMQLAALERIYQLTNAYALMRQGVTIIDPARFDMRGDVQIAQDVTIDVNVILEGPVTIASGCHIGPQVFISNSILHDNVMVKANSVIEGAIIGAGSIVGPFARLRPHTQLQANVHIGNFVEVKNSTVAASSKINHLSYIGDSDVGRQVNIGAGTITCNYDGANKHKTIIEDNVHIGSATQLVAPLIIGQGATIAAGSTITKDVPENGLTLTHRLEQRSLPDWIRPSKET